MSRLTKLLVVGALAASFPALARAQAKQYALESVAGLRLQNVVAEPATLDGRRGVRVMPTPEIMRAQTEPDMLAAIDGVEFSNGTIELEVAGMPAASAGAAARGFVGVAFRVQNDGKTYDAFYLRPTNGRADDQERRNHATQYISHPDWPWARLRQETPSRYESYVDLVPNTWTKVRIEVRGAQARLFVHDAPYPALVVNDVKTGASAKGAVALWIGSGTVAHFRNLTVTPDGSR